MLSTAISQELGFKDAIWEGKIFLLQLQGSRAIWATSSIGATELTGIGVELASEKSA